MTIRFGNEALAAIAARKNKSFQESKNSFTAVAANSNSVKIIDYEIHPNDPCAVKEGPPPGEEGSLGVQYIVAGTPDYVEKAFLPVIERLRSTLGVPDADRAVAVAADEERTKWALVTEPHLCRGVLRDVIPFFDIVIMRNTLPGGFRNPTLRSNFTRKSSAETKVEKGKYFGTGDETREEVLGWVKGMKVTGMVASPFKTTVLIDVDSIPCSADFAVRLKKELGSADIALTNRIVDQQTNNNGTDEAHYVQKGRKRNGVTCCNMHNSAVVVLNMASPNTHKLLRDFKAKFFRSTSRLPPVDQRALGVAMRNAWQEDRLQHVDLDNNIICRKKIWQEKLPVCGAVDNKCLVVHKMDKESYSKIVERTGTVRTWDGTSWY